MFPNASECSTAEPAHPFCTSNCEVAEAILQAAIDNCDIINLTVFCRNEGGHLPDDPDSAE